MMRLECRSITVFLVLLAFVGGCGLFQSAPVDDLQVLKPQYRGVVSITTIDGGGSGFVIAKDKLNYYVATAAHVVTDDYGMESGVAFVNGVLGTVVAFGDPDGSYDLAILRVPKLERRYKVYQIAETRQEAPIYVAGYVYVNGFDEPLFLVYHGRVVTTNWKGFLCHNAGIFPGMSGGPMFDKHGRVVGVCSRCPLIWGGIADSSGLYAKAWPLVEMLKELGL